jgi:hypothetical protein
MGYCRTRLLAIITAVLGLASGASLAHADPSTSGFTRIPLGHSVSAWYPIDINNDSLWELAITCGGTPTRIGIFSPKAQSWLDGPNEIPVIWTNWGAGDYNGDGMLEYAYLRSDTVWLHNTDSGSDSALWATPFQPTRATFWGESINGNALVGLTEDNSYHTEDWTYPDYPHYHSTYSWKTHVVDLLSGVEVMEFDGGQSSSPVIVNLPVAPANRLLFHHHYRTEDQFLFTQAVYYDVIYVVDPQWNRTPLLPLGSQYGSVGSPPDPAYFRHSAVDPIGPRIVVDVLTERTLRPCRISCQNVSNASVVWSHSFPRQYYFNFAAYDLNSDGQPALYLPLSSGAGWEVRSLTNGAIVDTLPGMPKADLQTGPLTVAGHQDLFYIADSGLYIWGLPTSVNDDQTHTTGLPTAPWLTAHPNPFNGNVHLDWSPGSGATTLDIYNILGQRIRNYDLAAPSSSRTSLEWDATDQTGGGVPSGIYFARLTGSGQPVMKKLVLLK